LPPSLKSFGYGRVPGEDMTCQDDLIGFREAIEELKEERRKKGRLAGIRDPKLIDPIIREKDH
jgi:hypothetical protein